MRQDGELILQCWLKGERDLKGEFSLLLYASKWDTDIDHVFYNAFSNISIILTIVMTTSHLQSYDDGTICPLHPLSSCPSALRLGCLSLNSWLVASSIPDPRQIINANRNNDNVHLTELQKLNETKLENGQKWIVSSQICGYSGPGFLIVTGNLRQKVQRVAIFFRR